MFSKLTLLNWFLDVCFSFFSLYNKSCDNLILHLTFVLTSINFYQTRSRKMLLLSIYHFYFLLNSFDKSLYELPTHVRSYIPMTYLEKSSSHFMVTLSTSLLESSCPIHGSRDTTL